MRRNQHDVILYLSRHQRALLVTVLDSVVPANGNISGAGGLGVAEYVEGFAGLIPSTRSLLSKGLKAVDATSARIYSLSFIDLPDGDKVDVLKQVESENAAFFDFIVQWTYAGYYTHPSVVRTNALPQLPPQPEGFEMGEFDTSLLENVRKRGKVYRDA